MLQKKQNMALNRAGCQLAFALASILRDVQLAVCYGANAMRVRCRSLCPKLLAFDTGQLCLHGHQPCLQFCI